MLLEIPKPPAYLFVLYRVKNYRLYYTQATGFRQGLKINYLSIFLDTLCPYRANYTVKAQKPLQNSIPKAVLQRLLFIDEPCSLKNYGQDNTQPNSSLIYVGKGTTYGDHDTAVFWYKPKDSDNYRVIYADLSVKEVTPDQLPK